MSSIDSLNISKISSELGWLPKYNLSSGLRKTIQWYLDNKNWLDTVVTRNNCSDSRDKNYQMCQEIK